MESSITGHKKPHHEDTPFNFKMVATKQEGTPITHISDI